MAASRSGDGQSNGLSDVNKTPTVLKGYRHASTLMSPAAPAVRRALGTGPTLLPLLPIHSIPTLLEELRMIFALPQLRAAWICLPRPARGGIVPYKPNDVAKLIEAFAAARAEFPTHWLGVSMPSKAGLYYKDIKAQFPGCNGFWMEASKFEDNPSGRNFDSIDWDAYEVDDDAELQEPIAPGLPRMLSLRAPSLRAVSLRVKPLLFGGVMLQVSYTMRDSSGTMSRAGKHKIASLIKEVAQMCDVPCLTVKHCSSQEIAMLAMTQCPLAVFDDQGSPSSLSFFRAKDVLIIVSQGLYTHSPMDGTRSLDLRKVQSLLNALHPPISHPEEPIATSLPPVPPSTFQQLVRDEAAKTQYKGMDLVYASGSFKVFLGEASSVDPENKQQLVAENVKAIVNCAPGCGLSNPLSSDPSVSYVELPVEEASTDEFKSNPTYHWPAVMRFMHHAMSLHSPGTSLLIHCQAGRTRSVTTLAIWMVLEGLASDLDDALVWIGSCRTKAAEADEKYVAWAREFIPSYRSNFREWVKFLSSGRSPNTHFHLVYAEADTDFKVFLGDFEAYIHTDWLLRENVKYIVNCCASDGLGNALPDHPGLDYIELTSDDMTHESTGKTDPRSQWPDIMRLMHRARTTPGSGNLFIHCLQGKNRSVATLSAWLAVERICNDVDQAVAWIRSNRPTVHPQVRYMQWAREFSSNFKLEENGEQAGGGAAGKGGQVETSPVRFQV